ncbi:MATH domain and coiled-coil domain-containing protein At3g58340-like [Lycium ferocissimum]|uniref:MATH domain and coiled-coil domain-containing protein At3g58340-like n=1 Tax=Lycium ferocissimum TaxID=112874 RepID=UPI002815EF76|nr:MATH domain and coiled-coil domain-containing protein At3g58340-like [Lycium ferocissimum]
MDLVRRMIIYPNGDDSIEGNDYISVYLAIADTSSLPAGWEADAVFSFFLFNQLCDNYLVIRGQVRRFHKIKAEWGCSKFISHKSLKEPCNGYLVDDNCILGAEVFVIKNQGVGECVSLLKDIECIKHEWNIFEFSKLGEQCSSKEFTVGDHKWKLHLYPNGNGCQRDQSISIFLASVDATGFDRRKGSRQNAPSLSKTRLMVYITR